MQVVESLMNDAHECSHCSTVDTITADDVNLPSVLAIICAAVEGNLYLRERVDMLLSLQERVGVLVLSYCSG